MSKRSYAILAGWLVAVGATSPAACGGRVALDAVPRGGAGAAGTSAAAGNGGSAGAGESTPSATRPDGTCVRQAFVHDGVCACQREVPVVCGDACVDPKSDLDNCGACGHACGATSTCVAGVCTRAPVSIVPARAIECDEMDLAVANGSVYWTEKLPGHVNVVDLATKNAVSLSTSEQWPKRISVRGNNVFWLDTQSGTIRQKLGRGDVEDLPAGPQGVVAYVAAPDGYTIFYSADARIAVASALGGGFDTVVGFAGVDPPDALALDGNTLVFLESKRAHVEAATLVPNVEAFCDAVNVNDQDVSVNCVTLDRGRGGLLVDAVFLVQGHAVWADYETVNLSPSTDRTGKDQIAVGDDNISGLAVAGDFVYFASAINGPDPTNGIIYKAPLKANQAAVPIARGQMTPRSLATDGTRVYWSTRDCAIRATDL